MLPLKRLLEAEIPFSDESFGSGGIDLESGRFHPNSSPVGDEDSKAYDAVYPVEQSVESKQVMKGPAEFMPASAARETSALSRAHRISGIPFPPLQ